MAKSQDAQPEKPPRQGGFRVCHLAVGPYKQGDIIPAKTFDADEEQRLLSLGAIAPESEPQSQPAPPVAPAPVQPAATPPPPPAPPVAPKPGD